MSLVPCPAQGAQFVSEILRELWGPQVLLPWKHHLVASAIPYFSQHIIADMPLLLCLLEKLMAAVLRLNCCLINSE